ncbi:MAG: thymidine phosphorylase family protein [Alphaproteobacteria bacterium]|nr:thymidine phosphorylase family protein [Alphaproteobacteria bacterium]
MNPPAAKHQLRARRLGLDTHAEAVIFLDHDSPVCRAEGFAAHGRVLLTAGKRFVIATLYKTMGDLVAKGEAALSEAAWQRLGLTEGDKIEISHPDPLASMSLVRARVYGHTLASNSFDAIVRDIAQGRYSNLEIAAFLTACAAKPLSSDEVLSLTRAMVNAGERLAWDRDIVVDKHSVGGLPGNRTTPIVVSIVTALGLTMPKTSSRAITSPAGTADTMEVLAPVALDPEAMHRVVEQEGGCIAWGGAVRLSPADDILIRIERALDIDTEGQMIASVLSKKIAAGATHLVLDMPVGETAKVRSQAAAEALSRGLIHVAEAFGIKAHVLVGDGSQPIGRGIGPVLEALDILSVLQNKPDAPDDLRQRGTALAGVLLELSGRAAAGQGVELATETLTNGGAWRKFQRICIAQGGLREPKIAPYREPILARASGRLMRIDNRKLAKLAKLAGAPEAKAAGLELYQRLDDEIRAGEPLCMLYAEAPGELAYALNYAEAQSDIFGISA